MLASVKSVLDEKKITTYEPLQFLYTIRIKNCYLKQFFFLLTITIMSYLKIGKCMQIICIGKVYLISHNRVQKKKKKRNK